LAVFGYLSIVQKKPHIKKNEMGEACSPYGEEERCVRGFGRETWRKGATWKTQM